MTREKAPMAKAQSIEVDTNTEEAKLGTRSKAPATTRKSRSTPIEKPARIPPTSGKALATYEKLISTAGELLGEVGFEKLTTNAICARANLTPPALYRYFADKYEILEELARRLLKRQYEAYAVWLFGGGTWAGADKRAQKLEEWFRIAAQIVSEEPGGVWTMRALRALPNLAHVRLESQRMFTDQMFAFYKRIAPHVADDLLWYRLRIRAEFGFVVDELAIEEDRIPHDVLFREAARMIGKALDDVVD
jgi:AcrR family transcriptional regulator